MRTWESFEKRKSNNCKKPKYMDDYKKTVFYRHNVSFTYKQTACIRLLQAQARPYNVT